MYGSLVTDDTYKRADGIFKSMVEIYNPNLKEFIGHAKAYEKSVVDEGKSVKAFQSAAVKIGIAATLSPGCKDVGKCIMDVTDAIQEVNMAKDAWIKKFGNDVLYNMEQRYEQDGKYIAGLRKKFQDDFKGRTSEVEKAMTSVAKLKKRSLNKPSSLKADTKLQKTYEKLNSAKTSAEIVAHEMLSRAFLEERRRYCYFVERQCEAIQALIEYHEASAGILKANLEDWLAVGNSQNDLLPGAIALLESSGGRHNSEFERMKSSSTRSLVVPATSEKRLEKHDSDKQKERHIKSSVSAQKIDVYNNPYRTTSSTNIMTSGAMSDESSIDHKNYFDLTEDRLSMPAYSSISKSSEMVFTGERASFIEARNVMPRHASESVDIVGWFATTDRGDKPSQESSQEKAILSDTDDGEVFVSPKPDSDVQGIYEYAADGIGDENSGKKQPESDPLWYESLYDYVPEANSNKLELRRGDKIINCCESRGGWLYGESVRMDKKGWFPANYCKRRDANDYETQPGRSQQMRHRDGADSPRVTRNIFRFSRDIERTLDEARHRSNSRKSWQL